ncbi:sulfatase-like hydrolase/transferase, partial [Tibeticola sp.]|uniref:sulfatase-like hydrolase/transferase n=1 Tax=Tibeticola sp. TaxID=2005368 RepID=UPI0025850F55
MKTIRIRNLMAVTFYCLLMGPLALPPVAAEEGSPMDRSVLPIPEPTYPKVTTLDARNAKAPPRFEVKAPAKAPNVSIILGDDMGFGQPSAFGGPIHMPTLEKMAKGGLSYNQFHTTALCSPTRAALL